MQRLIARHRAELAAAQEQAALDAARETELQRAQHEQDTRQLRDRLAKVCARWQPVVVRQRVAVHVQELAPQLQFSSTVGRVRNACGPALHPQDQDDVVERERVASAARLREACERYEQQMQVGRRPS